jgi:hypothetical protein
VRDRVGVGTVLAVRLPETETEKDPVGVSVRVPVAAGEVVTDWLLVCV